MIIDNTQSNQNESESAELDSLEAQLRASLADIQRKKAEIELRNIEKTRLEREQLEQEHAAREATRQHIIRVTGLVGSMVVVRSDYREDLVEFWRAVPGRMYRGNQENGIPIGEWIKHVHDDLTQLPRIEIIYSEGVKEQIDIFLNTPNWLVSIENKRFKLTPGPAAYTGNIYSLPGVLWDHAKHIFTASLAEGWRLSSALAKIEGVVYTDDARDFILKQIEARAALDKIGEAKDWDYTVNFNGDNHLRPFQKVGCAFVEATQGKALLAYQMGLGKTWMALAHAIKHNLRTVIVCPASLRINWSREIYKLSGKRANVMTGSDPTEHDLIKLLTEPDQFTLINYDILARKVDNKKITVDAEGFDHQKDEERYFWVELLNMSKPDLLIIDESHYIKNTDSNRSKAVRKMEANQIIHMTGTPVMNRPGELWPILTMLAPDLFPSEELFIRQYTWDGKRARNVEQLHETLRNIMIRRKQSDVIDDIPPLNRLEQYHELSPKARKVYKRVLQGVYEKIAAYDARGMGGEQNVANILVQIQRLKQVCAIDKIDRTAELAFQLNDSASEDMVHNKVLIFSQFKAVAFAIAQRLGHEALCFVTRGQSDFITANDVERDRLVQQFQNDPEVKYLVVTEKTAKEGHNITAAGYVIFNDLFWTPAAHEQCEGRAYMRVNDPHGIEAYYIIVDKTSGEIEEWIWELLAMKSAMIEETVEGVESSRDSSIAMDLIAKVKQSMWQR